MVPQTNLYEQYLELKKNQPPILPQQEKSLYQKYLESKEKKEPTPVEEVGPADWKKELPGAIKETWEELPAAQLGKREYWEETAKNLARQTLQPY